MVQPLVTRCQDIFVKHVSQNHQTQHICFRDGPTSSQSLKVTDDGVRLQIAYLGHGDRVVKLITFPLSALREYSCENVQDHG